MFSHFRYPTKQQALIWLKRRQRVPPSTIADELKVSRPFVSQAQRIAEQRIHKLILNAAEINRIRLDNISEENGFAVGFCPVNGSRTFITYSPKFRVQLWFEHHGHCESCEAASECMQILTGLAAEWQIDLPEGIPPTEIAITLFGTIMRRLNW